MSCLRRALPTLPRLTPLLLAVLVGPLASCSALIGADEEQCTVDADCAARGAAFKGSSCVNHKGYFEITSPDAITTLSFPPEHLHDGIEYPLMKLVPLATLTGYADAFGTALDMTLGHIIFGTLDCQQTPAAGISATIDLELPSTRLFYLRDDLPSKTATSTDKAGLAGYINLGKGTVTVTGTLATTKQKIGSRSVLIRPGAVSFFGVGPNL